MGRLAEVPRAAAWALLGLWLLLGHPALIALATDRFSRTALALLVALGAAAAALPGPSRWLRGAILRPSAPVFVGAVAALCAALSAWMTWGVLGGKVMALDSSVYLLQARAMSHLEFGIPAEIPRLSSSARFLFEGPDGRLFGVFPPGYPLFLVPFVLAGVPMLSGPVTAVALVVAQYALGKRITGDEWAARASLLLGVASCARAMETSDLLSHAFTALLSVVAIGAALEAIARPRLPLALLAGAAAGWALCARMLDGLVLGAVVAGLLAASGARHAARLLPAALLAAAPFVALLLVQQKEATGRWMHPTQYEFFRRSDYPPTCHRLGLGPDIGCSLEHPPERASFGPDGYTIDDALRVGRERAVVLGSDLLGLSPLILLAFLALLSSPTAGALACGAYWVGLSLAYLLFYYGNAAHFGARHLYPAAPFIYVLVGWSLARLPRRLQGRFDGPHVAGGALAVMVVLGALAQIERWRQARTFLGHQQSGRPDAHALLADARGKLAFTDDQFGFIAALDPWRDGGKNRLVIDDFAGLVEARRAHPDLEPVKATPRGLQGLPPLDPLPPGLHVELDQAWPSFLYPEKIASKRVNSEKFLKVPASGGWALGFHHAAPGGHMDISFDAVSAGRYVLWMDGVAGPDLGRYDVSLDGQPLFVWEGFAPQYEARSGDRSAPVALSRGRHVLRLACAGKAPDSRGFLAVIDVLRGEPAAD